MGQKIIPISLRLNKNKNWNSKWIVEKNKYSSLLHFDLEIKKYFEIIYNHKNFKLLKIDIIKTSKNINIYVYIQKNSSKNYKLSYNKIINHLNLYYPNNNIKVFIKNIETRNFQILRKSIKNFFFFIKKTNRITPNIRKMVYNFAYGLFFKKINIISSFIKNNLSKKKSHKKQIKILNKNLKTFFSIFSNLLGYRLQFKGRLNGSKRKKKLIYQEGKIPLNTLKYDIQYDFNEFKTPSGICSIKLWFFFKKDNQHFFKKRKIINKLKKLKIEISKKKINVISKKN